MKNYLILAIAALATNACGTHGNRSETSEGTVRASVGVKSMNRYLNVTEKCPGYEVFAANDTVVPFPQYMPGGPNDHEVHEGAVGVRVPRFITAQRGFPLGFFLTVKVSVSPLTLTWEKASLLEHPFGTPDTAADCGNPPLVAAIRSLVDSALLSAWLEAEAANLPLGTTAQRQESLTPVLDKALGEVGLNREGKLVEGLTGE